MKSMQKPISLYLPLFFVLYQITLYLSNDAYLPALPQIKLDFATTLALTQMTLSLWFLGSASSQLFIGPLCDRYGRRRTVFVGGFMFVLSTLLCVSAQNITFLQSFSLKMVIRY